ncbi:substrate-binding periplasmic protein [Shewanella sp.]|uniref:substrate-binding periplasmic protein n=1 Tax=Shewanella sp. TaxID=50422 RepID=UPI003562DCD9
MRCNYLVFFSCLLMLLASPVQSDMAPLKFCVEDTEFPPFNYFLRHQGSRTAESAGFDVDLLARVFTDAGIAYKVVALPWRRCLREVREGLLDGAMSASLNDERRQQFIPSIAYYHLTPSYFYLTADMPANFMVASMHELTQHGAVCGIKGFNYANFGWSSQDTLNEIKELQLLPSMLKLKRCRFFLERLETLRGTLLLNGMQDLAGTLSARAVPGSQLESFHMLISRRSPRALLISDLFNRKVAQLMANGELQQLLDYHQQQLELQLNTGH